MARERSREFVYIRPRAVLALLRRAKKRGSREYLTALDHRVEVIILQSVIQCFNFKTVRELPKGLAPAPGKGS